MHGDAQKDLNKNVKKNTSFVGSIAYLAPEILKKQEHSKSLDWYLTGVLLYEMIVGIPPYYHNNRRELFDNILTGPLRIPHTMSMEARDLILNLLNRNPNKRLGASLRDADDIKEHAFFKTVNWDDVYNQTIKMPTIEVKDDHSINPDAEKAFLKGEAESEQIMKNVYKEMEKFGTVKGAK